MPWTLTRLQISDCGPACHSQDRKCEAGYNMPKLPVFSVLQYRCYCDQTPGVCFKRDVRILRLCVCFLAHPSCRVVLRHRQAVITRGSCLAKAFRRTGGNSCSILRPLLGATEEEVKSYEANRELHPRLSRGGTGAVKVDFGFYAHTNEAGGGRNKLDNYAQAFQGLLQHQNGNGVTSEKPDA